MIGEKKMKDERYEDYMVLYFMRIDKKYEVFCKLMIND